MHPVLVSIHLLTVTTLPNFGWFETDGNPGKVEYIGISASDELAGDTQTITGPVSISPDSVFPSDIKIIGDATIDGTVEGEIELSKGMLNLEGKADGHVVVAEGSYIVSGTVWGDLVTIESEGMVSGEIHGDVLVFGGLIQLDSTALIKGNLTVIDGELSRNLSSVVRGKTYQIHLGFLGRWLKQMMMSRWKSADTGHRKTVSQGFTLTNAITRLVFYVVVYLLGMFFLVVLRRWHKNAEDLIDCSPWKMVLTGVIYYLVAAGILALFIVSVIGLALLPFAILTWNFIALMGTGQISLWTGKRVKKWFKIGGESRIGSYSMGFLALYMVSILGTIISLLGPWADVPARIFRIIGSLVTFAGSILGCGGIIYVMLFSRQTRAALVPKEQGSGESKKR